MTDYRTMTDYPLDQAEAILDRLTGCPDDWARRQVLMDALRPGYDFRDLAYYLADCHAASLELLPKSASKSLRTRLKSICASAAHCFITGDRPHTSYTSEGARSRVTARCCPKEFKIDD